MNMKRVQKERKNLRETNIRQGIARKSWLIYLVAEEVREYLYERVSFRKFCEGLCFKW
jgi:nicotinic acid mononucleotide adenylyltransferase